jgi:predicted HD phosphohydrolase
MADMTEDDLRLINADADDDAAKLPGRLMDAVAELENFQGALPVTRLEHSLQSATRAHRAGMDKEYVAAALLHDIGDALAPVSHGEMVGAVLRPFVSERVCWIVQKHALFQAYYYAHLMGEDRNARDKYLDHPYYDDCVEFCEHFDQNCFDPEYDSLPLEFFRPIVRRSSAAPLRGGRAARLSRNHDAGPHRGGRRRHLGVLDRRLSDETLKGLAIRRKGREASSMDAVGSSRASRVCCARGRRQASRRRRS